MGSLRQTAPSSRARGRTSLACAVLALALAASACRQEPSSGDASRPPATGPGDSSSDFSLRVPSKALSRVEISSPRARTVDRHVVVERAGDGWRIVSPIEYPANQVAMESIVAVLAEIEITSSEAADQEAALRHHLDEATGIEVKAWVGDRVASHFVVGQSTREVTYVRRADDARILTVRGRCRPLFDRTLEQLRHPVITSFAATGIVGVKYANPFGKMEFVPAPKRPGRFVLKGVPIRNFDEDRATKNVAVLANLLAKGFVDDVTKPSATGLFNQDTPRATLLVRDAGGVRSVDVWVGARTADGRLYLRTSESEQIYLVSSHLETSLVPRRSHFERSDERVRQLEAHRDTRGHGEASHGNADASAHKHGLPEAPPTQVPPGLMRDLRALASAQR